MRHVRAVERRDDLNPEGLIGCETWATITTHLRSTADIPPSYYRGHFREIPTLCGLKASWDIKSPIESTSCRLCREKSGLPCKL